ncbi:MAG: DoxX family protein [Ferruginibacter sp.]|nr:DoxX family protein [Ferruginibacter sp.]
MDPVFIIMIKLSAMDLQQKTPNDQSIPHWLTLARIVLGLTILWKGISFFRDASSLETILQNTGSNIFSTNSQSLAFIITYLHLLGGLFIAVGLFTRWVSILLIPIVLGAIIFVTGKSGISFNNGELLLSVIVLILLVVFAIKGSGTISADEYFRSYTYAGKETGKTKKFFQ